MLRIKIFDTASTGFIPQGKESQAGTSREFKQRIQICLREARETNYPRICPPEEDLPLA